MEGAGPWNKVCKILTLGTSPDSVNSESEGKEDSGGSTPSPLPGGGRGLGSQKASAAWERQGAGLAGGARLPYNTHSACRPEWGGVLKERGSAQGL